jgi:hypothetical protein
MFIFLLLRCYYFGTLWNVAMHKVALPIATPTGNHWLHLRLRLRRTDDGNAGLNSPLKFFL